MSTRTIEEDGFEEDELGGAADAAGSASEASILSGADTISQIDRDLYTIDSSDSLE